MKVRSSSIYKCDACECEGEGLGEAPYQWREMTLIWGPSHTRSTQTFDVCNDCYSGNEYNTYIAKIHKIFAALFKKSKAAT